MSVVVAWGIIALCLIVELTFTTTMILRYRALQGHRLWHPFRHCFFGQHDTYILRYLSATHEKVKCARCQGRFLVNSGTGVIIPWDRELDRLEVELDVLERLQKDLRKMMVPVALREAAEILSDQGFE